MKIKAQVALRKKKYPERFCPVPKCLWRTEGGEFCPRHSSGTSKSQTPNLGFQEQAKGEK